MMIKREKFDKNNSGSLFAVRSIKPILKYLLLQYYCSVLIIFIQVRLLMWKNVRFFSTIVISQPGIARLHISTDFNPRNGRGNIIHTDNTCGV